MILPTETLSLKYNIVLEEYEFLVLQRLCIMMVLLEELFTVSRVHEENYYFINSSESCGQIHDIKKTILLFY